MIDRSASMRARVAVPAAMVAAWMSRRLSVRAQSEDARQERPNARPLPSLLSLVPADYHGLIDADQIAMFADIAAQLAVAGIEPPDSIDDDERISSWINAIYPLAIAGPFSTNALQLGRSLIGFDLTDIDQTLEFGEPPFSVVLVRGRIDRDAVASAWEANEYRLLDIDGVTVASLHEDHEIDMESELGRIALTRMNNAVFLPDGTLAYTRTLDDLKEVLATASGAFPSLASRVDVAALLTAVPEPIAGAILVQGSGLSRTALIPPNLGIEPETLDELLAELADPMVPPIALALIGMTPGGPTTGDPPPIVLPAATVIVDLLMAAPGTAEAAASTIDKRLREMSSLVSERPYVEIFASWAMEPSADGTMLSISLTPGSGMSISIWLRMLYERDLLFLAW